MKSCLVIAMAFVFSASVVDAKPKRRARGAKKAQARRAQASVPPAGPAKDETRTLRRGERVEFDARLIQGQLAKAGAVYLFQRVGGTLKSMVGMPHSFRGKIVRPVYPRKRGRR